MSYSANVIIGIDLGTTNSCVAFMDGSRPKVIVNKEGNMTTPSIYAETKNGTRLIGEAAKRQLVVNTRGTVYGAKRLIGRKIDDKEIQSFINSVGYACEKGKNGEIEVIVEGKEKNKYTPAQIGSFVLQEIKRYAEDFLGTKVKDAVITVPAYFNDAQRQATKDAGTIAGLNVLRVINEPTAAALAYGFDQVNNKSDKTIAVYDFGGGTFDVSILEIGNGITEVKATNGDTNLGGTDFDIAIKQYLIDEFKKETSVDLSKDDLALQRLVEASEKAKIALSNSTSTEINLPYISSINGVPQHMQITMTRAKLESLTKHLIDRTLGPCKTALNDAGKKINEIDEVILVGGMTRMPKIIEFVKEFFGKTPNMGVNPDEVVAMGAAIQGGVLSGDIKDVLLLDVTPLSLGIETLGGVFSKLIEKNTTIPTKKTQMFSTAADNQHAVTIKVYQGEREIAAHNKLLGSFDLVGIPPAPRGMPKINVTFDIDANGIVHVEAEDAGSGKKQKIEIQNGSGLSKEEIEKMIRDAEKHAEEDKKYREIAEIKNRADTAIHEAEKALSEYGEKISGDIKDKIHNAINDLKDVIKKQDSSIEELNSKLNALIEITMKIGESVYGKSAPESDDTNKNSEKPNNDSSSNNDETIIDTDYKNIN